MDLTKNKGSVLMMTAGVLETDRYFGHVFYIQNGVNFISNDSDSNDLLVNFDSPVGEAGTIRLKPGEILSDYPINCNKIYVQGDGARVPFRAVGV